MWIQRTPDEIAKWQQAAESEAISHGRMVAGIVWLLVSLVSAGGWFFIFSSGTGIVIQRDATGDFWTRVPAFGLLAAPFAWWTFRYETRKQLARITQRTICPACDTAGEGNAGATCKCGGSFVLSSSVKWVEK